MSPERLALLKRNAPNYDDYSAREDVAELVVEVERLKAVINDGRPHIAAIIVKAAAWGHDMRGRGASESQTRRIAIDWARKTGLLDE